LNAVVVGTHDGQAGVGERCRRTNTAGDETPPSSAENEDSSFAKRFEVTRE
jgi:hypothetical protein